MPNVSWLATLTKFYLSLLGTLVPIFVYYFKSKKKLNYDRFVDLNILGASRLVHSDLRIYRISFFLLDIMFLYSAVPVRGSAQCASHTNSSNTLFIVRSGMPECETLTHTLALPF